MRRLLLIALITALCGCGGGAADEKVVGAWRGEIPAGNGKSLVGADLSIDKDHHFRELFRNLEILGSWNLSGSELSLATEKVSGLSVDEYRKKLLELADRKKDENFRKMAAGLDQKAIFILSPDGKSLTPKGGGSMVFKRQSP